jgi:hypothetical protein
LSANRAATRAIKRSWDPTFSGHSYGFRPGRSAHQAVAQAQRYVAAGYSVVVDLDLEKFFDRVNHCSCRTCSRACWISRSAKQGTPSFLTPPFGLRISTRLTGCGLVGSFEQSRPNAWPVLTQVVHGLVDSHPIDAGAALVLANAFPPSYEILSIAHLLH